MDKTLESLAILSLLNKSIQKYFQTLANIPIEDHETASQIFDIVRNLTIIRTTSFIEEWDKFLGIKTEIKDQDIILQLKKTASPAINRIRQWTGMKKLRDTFLVHNLRSQKNNYAFVF